MLTVRPLAEVVKSARIRPALRIQQAVAQRASWRTSEFTGILEPIPGMEDIGHMPAMRSAGRGGCGLRWWGMRCAIGQTAFRRNSSISNAGHGDP